ncbi:hypothetical protein [Achromobacter kerstersii]
MPSIKAPAIRKRMVRSVRGGQSRTAILAAAKAELHKKQNAAIGNQLIPGAPLAVEAVETAGVAFIGDPGGQGATHAAWSRHSARLPRRAQPISERIAMAGRF